MAAQSAATKGAGAFLVPRISSSPTLRQSSARPIRSFQGGKQIDESNLAYDVSVSKLTTAGTNVGLSVNGSRAETNDASAAINPRYGTTLGLTVNQPLLRGRGQTREIVNLRQQEIDYDVALNSFKSTLNDTIGAIVASYWEYAFSLQDMAIKDVSLAKAEEQYLRTKGHIEQGLLPKTDIYVVEENFIRFKEQRQIAKTIRDNRHELMRQYLPGRPSCESIADDPSTIAEPLGPAEALGELMRQKNPLLASKQLAVERLRLQVDFLGNQSLPQLDLFTGLTTGGPDQGFVGSLNRFGSSNYEGSLGLTFSMPVTTSLLREQALAARKQQDVAVADYGRAQRDMETALRTAINDVVLKEAQLDLKKTIAQLAEKKLRGEEEKYQLGLSSLNYLVDFQRQSNDAKSALLRAQIDRQLSYLAVYKLIGTLYERYGVAVAANREP